MLLSLMWFVSGGLEEDGTHTTHFTLLLHEDLKVLIDNGDSEQNSSSRSNGTKEISQNGESSNAETTEGSGSGDVSVEFVNHALLTVTPHQHLLVTELPSNILGRRSAHINPRLGEEST